MAVVLFMVLSIDYESQQGRRLQVHGYYMIEILSYNTSLLAGWMPCNLFLKLFQDLLS